MRVIDFGVARSSNSDVAITSLQTDVGQLIGTLQYMSPEQCAGDPAQIDTRSDVYALGVVPYELLAGQLPYDLSGLSVYQAASAIQDAQPARLSSLDVRLRGELETIVEKALEKDPARRYRSAAELADDLRRYLRGEAIAARPPSVWYQLRVFTRQHKTLVSAAARREDLELAKSLLDLGIALHWTGDLALLPEAEKHLRRALDIQRGLLGKKNPRIAYTQNELAPVLMGRENYQEAAHHRRQAIAIYEQIYGANSRAVFQTRFGLGRCLWKLGKLGEAKHMMQPWISYCASPALPGKGFAGSIASISRNFTEFGQLLTANGNYPEAKEQFTKAFAMLGVTDITNEQLDIGRPGDAQATALREELVPSEKRVADFFNRAAGAGRAHLIRFTVRSLIDLYDAWDKPEEAARWRAILGDDPPPENPA